MELHNCSSSKYSVFFGLAMHSWYKCTYFVKISLSKRRQGNIKKLHITVWYSSCTEAEKKWLQRTINTAKRITGCSLPALQDLYTYRCLSRAKNIIKDPSHPSYNWFDRLCNFIYILCNISSLFSQRYVCHWIWCTLSDISCKFRCIMCTMTINKIIVKKICMAFMSMHWV